MSRGSEQVPVCDKCEKLDKKIEHYETIVVSIGDRATVERFMAMIAIYRRKRRRFIPSKSSRPPWRPLSFVGPLSVARNTAPPWGSGHSTPRCDVLPSAYRMPAFGHRNRLAPWSSSLERRYCKRPVPQPHPIGCSQPTQLTPTQESRFSSFRQYAPRLSWRPLFVRATFGCDVGFNGNR